MKPMGMRWTFLLMLGVYAGNVTETSARCEGEDLISKPEIFAFFPKDKLDQWCSIFPKTFECLFSLGKSQNMIWFYQTQQLPIDYVCWNKQEYLQSQTCFLTEGLQENVQRCLRRITILDCRAVVKATRCVRDHVLSKEATCSQTDADLLVKLTRLFFKPIRRNNNCPELSTSLPPSSSTTTQLPISNPSKSSSSSFGNRVTAASDRTTTSLITSTVENKSTTKHTAATAATATTRNGIDHVHSKSGKKGSRPSTDARPLVKDNNNRNGARIQTPLIGCWLLLGIFVCRLF